MKNESYESTASQQWGYAKLEAGPEYTGPIIERPFDPRTEVSADARNIVRHLWIIFVLLPALVGAILYVWNH